MAETEEEKYRKLRDTLAIGEVPPKAGEPGAVIDLPAEGMVLANDKYSAQAVPLPVHIKEHVKIAGAEQPLTGSTDEIKTIQSMRVQERVGVGTNRSR